MLIKHIALVSETPRVTLTRITVIAAAIQKQVMRDFAPVWNEQATVAAFDSLADVPSDYWPVIIRDDIGLNAAGVHLSDQGQPFALVDADADISVTCSHEVLEMLADPFGNRLIAGRSLKPGQGRVNYLVEVCDPSEAYSYSINGIAVSDFYTRDFFAPVASPGTRYSFMGVISGPRTVLSGGYISWVIPETDEWWQLTYFGTKPVFKKLGVLKRTDGKSWREIVDALTPVKAGNARRRSLRSQNEPFSTLENTSIRKLINQFTKSG